MAELADKDDDRKRGRARHAPVSEENAAQKRELYVVADHSRPQARAAVRPVRWNVRKGSPQRRGRARFIPLTMAAVRFIPLTMAAVGECRHLSK